MQQLIMRNIGSELCDGTQQWIGLHFIFECGVNIADKFHDEILRQCRVFAKSRANCLHERTRVAQLIYDARVSNCKLVGPSTDDARKVILIEAVSDETNFSSAYCFEPCNVIRCDRDNAIGALKYAPFEGAVPRSYKVG